MGEMMVQNLMNMNLNQSNKSSKNEVKKGPKVFLDKTKNAKKTFRKLLEENNSKNDKSSEKMDFSKLLDLLNLSTDELKKKIANMDEDEISDMEGMVQIALASILEKTHNVELLNNLKEFGISEDLLEKIKAKLSFMQKLINQQKENLGMIEKDNSENKFFKLNSSQGNNTNDQNNTVNNDNVNNRNNNLNNKKANNVKGKIINDSSELAKDNKEIIGAKINLSDTKDLSKSEKIYYETLKKQANAQRNATEQSSVNLKNNVAGELNSELKANLDFKELGKDNNLKELLSKENLTSFDKSLKTKGNQQNSTFSNMFSGNQQDNKFSQFFGPQNLAQVQGNNTLSSVNNNSQFQTAVLQSSELARQVTDQIKLLNKPANNEIKLQLEPEFLGKVKMSLKVDAGKVTARFMVDNVLVKNHLDQNISQLKLALTNQGFNVDNMEVEAENTSYDMGDESDSGQFFQDEQSGQRDQHFSYEDYEDLPDDLMKLDPEQLDAIMETDPQKLKKWGYMKQNNWLNYGGYYRQMNLLA